MKEGKDEPLGTVGEDVAGQRGPCDVGAMWDTCLGEGLRRHIAEALSCDEEGAYSWDEPIPRQLLWPMLRILLREFQSILLAVDCHLD